jgi:hypothetical protein
MHFQDGRYDRMQHYEDILPRMFHQEDGNAWRRNPRMQNFNIMNKRQFQHADNQDGERFHQSESPWRQSEANRYTEYQVNHGRRFQPSIRGENRSYMAINTPEKNQERVGYYLPKFDGQNLSAWLIKVHQCFNYYDTPDDFHRYMLASYHMEGKALTWLVEMERKGVFTVDTDWNNLVRLIQSRFGHHCEAEQKLQNYQNQHEISVEQRKFKDFQEPEILEEGRNVISEERKTIEKLEVSGVPEYLQEPEENAYVASDPQVESVEEEIPEHKDQSFLEKNKQITTLPIPLGGVVDQRAESFIDLNPKGVLQDVIEKSITDLSTAVRAMEEWPLMKERKQKKPIQILSSLGVDNAQNQEVQKSRMDQDIKKEDMWQQDDGKFFDEKLKRNLEDGIFFFWCSKWGFDPGITNCLPTSITPSTLSFFVFQSLKEYWVIFVMWKHRWLIKKKYLEALSDMHGCDLMACQ